MSKTIDIKKVDSNFINKENLDDSIHYIDPKVDDSVKIYGLYWFNEDRRYHRLSKSLDDVLPQLEGSVDVLAGNSSGGLIAFYSNTNVLKIKVKLSFKFHMGHMPYTGQAEVTTEKTKALTTTFHCESLFETHCFLKKQIQSNLRP